MSSVFPQLLQVSRCLFSASRIDRGFGRGKDGLLRGGLRVTKKSRPENGVQYLDTVSPSLYDILNQDNLRISRRIEWLNLTLGYDQANVYDIFDGNNGYLLGHICEEASFSRNISRLLLGNMRPFKAHVLDTSGNTLMSVSRGFTIINTRMSVCLPAGEEVGIVQQIWHPIHRKYELYDTKKQFGVIDEGFLSWSFGIRDERGRITAQIDRVWSNAVREVFTDAGYYQVQFNGGSSPDHGNPLSLYHRIVALGCVITIDLNYFTRSGGFRFFYFPMGGQDYKDGQ